MSATLEDLRAEITLLKEKVTEDVAQTATLLTAVNALIAKIPAAPDYQAEVDAVRAITVEITSDNPAVQAAIDAANA